MLHEVSSSDIEEYDDNPNKKLIKKKPKKCCNFNFRCNCSFLKSKLIMKICIGIRTFILYYVACYLFIVFTFFMANLCGADTPDILNIYVLILLGIMMIILFLIELYLNFTT